MGKGQGAPTDSNEVPGGNDGLSKRRMTVDGYVQVWHEGRWRLQHRVVCEREMGRKLKGPERVHHLNGQRGDNRVCNLVVFASQAAHSAWHEGKTSKAVWDGRRQAGAAANAPANAALASLRCRVVKMGSVKWREMMWFQGDLKRIERGDLAKLKAQLLAEGCASPFAVWDAGDGRYMILDGHQRRTALLELVEDGHAVPDELPGYWLDCKDEAEARKVMLILSSRYGRLVADELEAVLKDMEASESYLANLQVADVDVGKLMENLARRDDELAAVVPEIAKPAKRWKLLKVLDDKHVGKVMAILNREGIRYEEMRDDALAKAD